MQMTAECKPDAYGTHLLTLASLWVLLGSKAFADLILPSQFPTMLPRLGKGKGEGGGGARTRTRTAPILHLSFCNAVYLWWLTASPYLPGPPIWQIQAADLKDVINESINFWYVNIGLEAAGLPYVPAEAVSLRLSSCGSFGLAKFVKLLLKNNVKKQNGCGTATGIHDDSSFPPVKRIGILCFISILERVCHDRCTQSILSHPRHSKE